MTMPSSGQDGATGLTSREKDAIRASWALVNADPETHGLELLSRLFTERPSTQQYFDKFGDISGDKMRVNPVVRNHAASIMEAITGLVNDLDNQTKLVASLTRLGAEHHEQGVKSQDFKFILGLLRRLMKDGLADKYDTFTDESWAKCCDVIYSVIDAEITKRGSAP